MAHAQPHAPDGAAASRGKSMLCRNVGARLSLGGQLHCNCGNHVTMQLTTSIMCTNTQGYYVHHQLVALCCVGPCRVSPQYVCAHPEWLPVWA
jgi:hypothetical protein